MLVVHSNGSTVIGRAGAGGRLHHPVGDDLFDLVHSPWKTWWGLHTVFAYIIHMS